VVAQRIVPTRGLRNLRDRECVEKVASASAAGGCDSIFNPSFGAATARARRISGRKITRQLTGDIPRAVRRPFAPGARRFPGRAHARRCARRLTATRRRRGRRGWNLVLDISVRSGMGLPVNQKNAHSASPIQNAEIDDHPSPTRERIAKSRLIASAPLGFSRIRSDPFRPPICRHCAIDLRGGGGESRGLAMGEPSPGLQSALQSCKPTINPSSASSLSALSVPSAVSLRLPNPAEVALIALIYPDSPRSNPWLLCPRRLLRRYMVFTLIALIEAPASMQMALPPSLPGEVLAAVQERGEPVQGALPRGAFTRIRRDRPRTSSSPTASAKNTRVLL